MSSQRFLKDLTDYFVDIEFTDFDKKKIKCLFDKYINTKIVYERKVVEVEKIKVVKDIVERERKIYVDIVTGKTVRVFKRSVIHSINETYDLVIKDACEIWNVTIDELISRKKTDELVGARIFCFEKLRACGFSFVKIGQRFNRDHSTVMHGIDKLYNHLDTKTEPYFSLWNIYNNDAKIICDDIVN
jgi:chromosomal replication initiation ATPase DnaA